ncbi:Major egg antigen [Fasciola hepatica]|uniref:Major egg antigen n=1 Tax=Fasciola hepatica TaxID=6192 RepID=A0A2H1CPB2_FASHE|nr:Major egg antigen [Fasciola hepatica]
MSNYRTEMNIPVTRDARTFEQRRRDMLSNLERRTTTSTSSMSQKHVISGTDPMITRAGSDTTASSLTTDTGIGGSHHSLIRGHDNWDSEVDRWITETRSRWNEDMRRMRQDMFALEPVDDFGMDRWGPMGSIYPFDRPTEPSSMMAKMEREMQSLRQKMDSMSPISGTTRIMGPSASTIKSSTSRITTSSSTTSSGDPRNMVTKSNVEESVQHSRTVNGVTTGTSSHSAVSSTSHGSDQSQLTLSGAPGAVLPQSPVSGGMNFLKDAYELDEDGQVHFKVRFDAKDFAPEDIDVTTVENRLTVHAKKNIQSGSSTTSKEFCRTIDLPRSIDHEKFRCNLTEDGVLILDAPVKEQNHKHITFGDDRQLGIKPRSEAQESTRTVPLGISGPTVLKDGGNGRKLHLEVPVDPAYKAEDLCVRMDENRIIVSGKQEIGKERGDGSGPTREFTRSYEVPETVDPFSVTALLSGTTLIIEAPLLHTV